MKRAGFWMSLAMIWSVAVALAMVAGSVKKVDAPSLPLSRDKIAVVPVYGQLSNPDFVVRLLHRYRVNVAGVKAVVLAIDSPGGGVAAAQEIVEAIKTMQGAGIYVVAAMGSMAASGGYYIAAPCDKIVANAGTLTGSIGVIMETINAKKVLDKIGLDFEVVKSGEFKDAGNFSRSMNPRERQLFQGVIDDVYGQFVDVVIEERKGPIVSLLARRRSAAEQSISARDVRSHVRSFADGRVFSGRMALQYGLVDELGGLDKAIAAAAELAGIENPEVITYREPRTLVEFMTGISKTEIKALASQALGATTRRFGFYAW